MAGDSIMQGYGFGTQDSIKCDSSYSRVTHEERVSSLVRQAGPNGLNLTIDYNNILESLENTWIDHKSIKL